MPLSLEHLSEALSPEVSERTTEDESFDNMTKNLVGVYALLRGRARIGSGLLLTTDGFILTTNHQIAPCEGEIPERGLIAHDGKQYAVDFSIKAIDEKNDLAIIKANIPLEGKAIPYIVRNDATCGEEIRLFAAVDEIFYQPGNSFKGPNSRVRYSRGFIEKIDGEISTSAAIKTGYSGGICIRFDTNRPLGRHEEGALLGMVTKLHESMWLSDGRGYGSCAPISAARALVLDLCINHS